MAVTPVVTSFQLGDKTWNATSSDYPGAPTVMGGTTINFGADSCIEHPEPSTASAALWLPKTALDYMPKLGDRLEIRSHFDEDVLKFPVRVFTGKVDSITLVDDHKPIPAPYVPSNFATAYQNINLADWSVTYFDGSQNVDYRNSVTVMLGNRLYVPKPPTTSQITIMGPAVTVKSGASLNIKVSAEAPKGIYVNPLRVQEFNVRGQLLRNDFFTPDSSGVLTYKTRLDTTSIRVGYYYTYPTQTTTSVTWGDVSISYVYDPDPDLPGYKIRISASDALAEAGRMRIGDEPWPQENVNQRFAKIAALTAGSGVEFVEVPTIDQGYYDTLNSYVGQRDVDSFSALEAYQLASMAAGLPVVSINNKVQTAYRLLLPQVLAKNANGAYVTENNAQYTNYQIPSIPVGGIEDSEFEIDTSRTINCVAVDYKQHDLVEGVQTWEDAIFRIANEAGAFKTTPVTRSFKTDATNYYTYGPLDASIITKADLILDAQSEPQWRLSRGASLVLNRLTFTRGLVDLLQEGSRFGALIKINGAPSFIGQYQRIHAGRIVFGADPRIELELEPAEYSGPVPLTRDTAYADTITRTITIADMHSLTSNDLRKIGAR